MFWFWWWLATAQSSSPAFRKMAVLRLQEYGSPRDLKRLASLMAAQRHVPSLAYSLLEWHWDRFAQHTPELRGEVLQVVAQQMKQDAPEGRCKLMQFLVVRASPQWSEILGALFSDTLRDASTELAELAVTGLVKLQMFSAILPALTPHRGSITGKAETLLAESIPEVFRLIEAGCGEERNDAVRLIRRLFWLPKPPPNVSIGEVPSEFMSIASIVATRNLESLISAFQTECVDAKYQRIELQIYSAPGRRRGLVRHKARRKMVR